MRGPRRTFAERLVYHDITPDQLAAWVPRLIDEDKRRVMEARMRGDTLDSAGQAIGRSREKAMQHESFVFRAVRAAINNPTSYAHIFKEPTMTSPAVDRPTVVVHVTSGGIIEVVCADAPVRVILVDYGIDEGDDQARLAPDGDQAIIYEEVFGRGDLWLPVAPERVAEYEHALTSPLINA